METSHPTKGSRKYKKFLAHLFAKVRFQALGHSDGDELIADMITTKLICKIDDTYEKLQHTVRDFEKFAYRITVNAFIDYLRSYDKKRNDETVLPNEEFWDTLGGCDELKEAVERHELIDNTAQQIINFVKTLDPKDQNYFQLLFVELISCAEAAKIMDVSTRTVQNKRSYLKEIIGNHIKDIEC